MSPDEILRQLERVTDPCDFAPYEAALLAAAKHREALTPRLIAAIDRVSADPAHYLKHPDECLHSFAIYLLAQFRETRARDAFLRFLSLPGERLVLDLTGEMLTEDGAALLASVCGGDPAPLLQLAQDEAVNQYIRAQAIDGLAVQACWGERPRESVIADLRGLFTTLSKPGNNYVWAGLADVVCDFNAPELAPEARRAFAERLVDTDIMDLNGFEKELFKRGQTNFARFQSHNGPINAVRGCSAWLCSRDDSGPFEGWYFPVIQGAN